MRETGQATPMEWKLNDDNKGRGGIMGLNKLNGPVSTLLAAISVSRFAEMIKDVKINVPLTSWKNNALKIKCSLIITLLTGGGKNNSFQF